MRVPTQHHQPQLPHQPSQAMKVCINFGDIRCVVPVGDGSLPVKDVVHLAVERYKKATCKPANTRINVHTLKTSDGAILDLDDILQHVVDDREQLVALFDEHSNGSNHLYMTKANGSNNNLRNGDAMNIHNGSSVQLQHSNGIYGELNLHHHHHRAAAAFAAQSHNHQYLHRQPNEQLTKVNVAVATTPHLSGGLHSNVHYNNNINTNTTTTNGYHNHHNHYQHRNGNNNNNSIYGQIGATTAANEVSSSYPFGSNGGGFHHHHHQATSVVNRTQQHQPQHQRNDSISDSLISSNESPDLMLQQPTDHHQQHQQYRYSVFSPPPPPQPPTSLDNGNTSQSSYHRHMNGHHHPPHHQHNHSYSGSSSSTAAAQCHNTSLNLRTRPPIPAVNSAKLSRHNKSASASATTTTQFVPSSRSYDPNSSLSSSSPSRAANISFDPFGDGGSGIHSKDVVEITAEQMNAYSTMLHVRHGSEPMLTESSSSALTIANKSVGGGNATVKCNNINNNTTAVATATVAAAANTDLITTNGHHGLSTNKRWSTTAAMIDHTLPSRLLPAAANNKVPLNANYEHSDEEKCCSFTESISPLSNREEGYASEERPNSQLDNNTHHNNNNATSSSVAMASAATNANTINTPSSTPTGPLSPPSSATSPQSFGKFNRVSGRLSMLANNIDAWADAADRQLMKLKNGGSNGNVHDTTATTNTATEPNHQPHHLSVSHSHHQIYDSSLGSLSSSSQENESITTRQDDTNQSRYHNHHHHQYHQEDKDQDQEELSVIIDLAKEAGPLGIHVLPDNETIGGRLRRGLLIQGIEPGGRIDRDGRLHVGDIITEIDQRKFVGLAFEQAQEIFRSSLQNTQIRLRFLKNSRTSTPTLTSTSLNSHCDTQPSSLPSSSANTNHTNSEQYEQQQFQHSVELTGDEQLVEGETRLGHQAKVATLTSTRKHSTTTGPGPVTGSGATATTTTSTTATTAVIAGKPPTPAIVVANTRRIGKKYHIQLKKGEHGLGFSITTRDNPAGGLSPIYIKTILPRGAAVQDGRLKPGDRLLEVCGVEMAGKTQEEAVRILRNLPQDSIVDLIVSRQELEMSPSPLMPRQLPPEKVDEPKCSTANERQVLVFKIPLNDTGSAGLGVSVKGSTSNDENGQQIDMGIFVKSVIHGGAASKDGRLRQHDQLIGINDIPLSGKTNSEAMETLRRAMMHPAEWSKTSDGTNAITLTIARRICRSPSHCTSSGESATNGGDDSIVEQRYTTTTTTTGRHQHEASILSHESYDMSFNSPSASRTPSASPSKSSRIISTSPLVYSNNNNQQQHQYLNDSNEGGGDGGGGGGDGCPTEDSYRSSENTVIYNQSASVAACQNSNNNSSLHDSELSLVDDGGERFRRDGFGRQSMSEKRHAQLDAKNTDTYRRNKKYKEENRGSNETTTQSSSGGGGNQKDSSTTLLPPLPSTPCKSIASYGEDEQGEQMDQMLRIGSLSFKADRKAKSVPSVEVTPPQQPQQKSKSPTKQQMMQQLFSPSCCIKCQSPGSCPHHSKSDLDTNSRSRNGLYVKNINSDQSRTMPKELSMIMSAPFGALRKSCSLESLQMMMQDLQKEQLERVGGNASVGRGGGGGSGNGGGGENGFVGPRPGTVRVGRSRETNESFRVAVDRSYDIKNYMNCTANMDRVDEEFDNDDNDPNDQSSTSRPSTCPYRVGGGHSMTSTITHLTAGTTVTTTTNEDDQANLLKTTSNKSKKKGLFKNLFHFGSRKGRSKSASSEPRERKHSSNSSANSNPTTAITTATTITNADDLLYYRSPDLSRKYQIEQEKINAQYRKLLEQQQKQKQQLHQHQQIPFVRNRLSPTHQSLTHRGRSQSSPHTTSDLYQRSLPPLARGGGGGAIQHGSQHYGTNVMHRDTVGVPQQTSGSNTLGSKNNSYRRSSGGGGHHRVYPSSSGDHKTLPNHHHRESNSFVDTNNHTRHSDIGSRHLRGNSQDYYTHRQSLDRPCSRVAISEMSSVGNYANQQHMLANYANYGGGSQQQPKQQQIITNNGNSPTHPHLIAAQRLENGQHPTAEAQIQHHYRQLSLRNPQHQHQRQISSPAGTGGVGVGVGGIGVGNAQQYYTGGNTSGSSNNNNARPISSYFEYEQQQQTLMSGPGTYRSNNNNNEALYGALKRPNLSSIQQPGVGGGGQLVRQQKPIYHSNQVQIYGSVYNTVPHPQQGPPPSSHYDTVHRQSGGTDGGGGGASIYGNYGTRQVQVQHHIANNRQLPYQTKG